MSEATIIGIVTIIAVFAGPIAAVLVTRKIDDDRRTQRRRFDVFRDLMRTRRLRLSPDHVGALNLVEIEFHGEPQVISTWREYWSSLNRAWPQNPTTEVVNVELREQDRLLTRLLDAMAKSLNFQIEQMDIFAGGYTPQGWMNVETQQETLRILMIELLKGNRALPFTYAAHPTPSSPYPPPPSPS